MSEPRDQKEGVEQAATELQKVHEQIEKEEGRLAEVRKREREIKKEREREREREIERGGHPKRKERDVK